MSRCSAVSPGMEFVCTLAKGHASYHVGWDDECGISVWWDGNSPSNPPPSPSPHPDVWDFFLGLAADRLAKGEKAYGQRLKPFDGRDNLLDAWEEAFDLLQYLTKEIYQRNHETK